MKEREEERSPTIPIEFIYDPNFVPEVSSSGIAEHQLSEDQVKDYSFLVSQQWSGEIGQSLFTSFQSILRIDRHFFQKPLACHILRSRIKLSDSFFIEAISKPLAVWAIPPDQKWGYLPFHTRLIHEITHRSISLIPKSIWEVFEDEVWQENNGNFNLPPERELLDELVVRKITQRITSQCFGQEFGDWFQEREAKIRGSRENL
jgi:hypothetical protein